MRGRDALSAGFFQQTADTAEIARRVLIPRVALPEQFRRAAWTRRTPVFLLWLSVMEIALDDVRKAPSRSMRGVGNRITTREAISYFESPAEHLGSFRWLCEELGVCRQAALSHLRADLKRAEQALRRRLPRSKRGGRAKVVPPARAQPGEVLPTSRGILVPGSDYTRTR